MRIRALLIVGVAAVAASAWGPFVAPAPTPQQLAGWPLYDRFCLACHGHAGDGRGPAAPYTKGLPRDFTKGELKWRTTRHGATDDDLRSTIKYGAPGTSMHAFALSNTQVDELVAVVRAFGPSQSGTPIALAPPAAIDVARGAKLWNEKGCSACHAGGDGNSAAAKAMAVPPYDLTRELHRPRATDTPDARRTAAAMSIATGLPGTSMPGWVNTIPDADIWALADYVVSLRVREPKVDRSTMDAPSIARDVKAKTAVGVWPGTDPDEAKLFGGPIAPQGTPPAQLAPAQASLRANQCARCHNKQVREWEPSIHHNAVSPGLEAQMWGMTRPERAECLRCHAPLDEQLDDDALYADGTSCAGCHVRNWTRHGPANIAPSLVPLPGYPLQTLAIYERADFCLPCHQLPTRTEVVGKPLLNTYKEWLEGPYMKRGIQCQHCHMPNREHTFKGVHDPQTFREGVAIGARAHEKDGSVTVVAEIANVGAGHYLPTTPTPAAFLSITLLDAKGKPMSGASAKQRIGRDIYYDGEWHERADTRIPPGDKLTVARAWKVAGAKVARVVLEVWPDDYYERLYEGMLKTKLPDARRKLYEEALARAQKRHYVVETRDIPIR